MLWCLSGNITFFFLPLTWLEKVLAYCRKMFSGYMLTDVKTCIENVLTSNQKHPVFWQCHGWKLCRRYYLNYSVVSHLQMWKHCLEQWSLAMVTSSLGCHMQTNSWPKSLHVLKKKNTFIVYLIQMKFKIHKSKLVLKSSFSLFCIWWEIGILIM